MLLEKLRFDELYGMIEIDKIYRYKVVANNINEKVVSTLALNHIHNKRTSVNKKGKNYCQINKQLQTLFFDNI